MLKIKYLYLFLLLQISSVAFAQTSKLINNTDKHLVYMGRVLESDSCTKFFWCGTSVQIEVKNTSTISVIISENFDVDYYDVIIDGKFVNKIKVVKGKNSYILASDLNKQNHIVQIFKATNTDEHVTNFYGFTVDQRAKIIKQKNKKKLKMEYFGDSITAGHGIEVPGGMADTYFAEYFNNYLTYAAITSRYFNAQYHNTSKSGIGVTVSWDKAIMPEIYDRLNPNDSLSRWSFSDYQPDIVVVNLFQNDNALVNKPEHVQFKKRFGTTKPSEEFIINAYKNFISSLRTAYPKAKIVCVLGSMDAVKPGSKWPDYIKSAVSKLNDKKVYVDIFKVKKTFDHPRIADQQKMADELIKFIKENKLDR